jgi:tetratricopeptide (TPR) repeat protein
MRKSFYMIWLLFTCLCSPLLSRAQSPESNFVISVRQLSIPPKALHAYQQGNSLLAKKDPARSLPQFQRAISEFANFYEAYYKMGVADLNLWRIEDAEQAFRKSIDLSGEQDAYPLLALGAVLNYQHKFSEAETVLRQGLDLAPYSWSGKYSLGWTLFGLNRLEEAEKSVREALPQTTDPARVRLLLADILSREKDYAALVNDLDEYLKLAPDTPTAVRAKALRDKAQQALAESKSTAALAQSQP